MRGALKTLVLGPIPAASGFRQYQFALYVKVCAASRHDGQSTMGWIQKEEKSSLDELEVVDRRWKDMGILFAQAVLVVATGTLKKELDHYQDTQARQGRPTLGRAALHIVYHKFHLSASKDVSADEPSPESTSSSPYCMDTLSEVATSVIGAVWYDHDQLCHRIEDELCYFNPFEGFTGRSKGGRTIDEIK